MPPIRAKTPFFEPLAPLPPLPVLTSQTEILPDLSLPVVLTASQEVPLRVTRLPLRTSLPSLPDEATMRFLSSIVDRENSDHRELTHVEPIAPRPREPTPAPRPTTPALRATTLGPRATTPGPRATTPALRATTPAPRAATPAPRAVTPGRDSSQHDTPHRHARFVSPTLSALTELESEEESDPFGNDEDEGKIPKPTGEVGRPGRNGYNLQEALRWKPEQYRALQALGNRLVDEFLNDSESFMKQPIRRVYAALKAGMSAMPRLTQYSRAWPLSDVIKMRLKYTSHQKRLIRSRRLGREEDEGTTDH